MIAERVGARDRRGQQRLGLGQALLARADDAQPVVEPRLHRRRQLGGRLRRRVLDQPRRLAEPLGEVAHRAVGELQVERRHLVAAGDRQLARGAQVGLGRLVVRQRAPHRAALTEQPLPRGEIALAELIERQRQPALGLEGGVARLGRGRQALGGGDGHGGLAGARGVERDRKSGV